MKHVDDKIAEMGLSLMADFEEAFERMQENVEDTLKMEFKRIQKVLSQRDRRRKRKRSAQNTAEQAPPPLTGRTCPGS